MKTYIKFRSKETKKSVSAANIPIKVMHTFERLTESASTATELLAYLDAKDLEVTFDYIYTLIDVIHQDNPQLAKRVADGGVYYGDTKITVSLAEFIREHHLESTGLAYCLPFKQLIPTGTVVI